MSNVKTRACGTTICALVLLAGCQKAETPMTEESFCAEYARIECSKVAAFCSFNPANCEPARVLSCKADAVPRKAGGRAFVPGNTERCLKKLEEAYQTLPINPAMLKAIDEACSRVYEGSAKALESCTADNDCAGGLICDKALCGTAKVVPTGAQCSNIGERCQPNEYCTITIPNGPWRCIPRIGEDMACSRDQPCLDSLRCRTTCRKRLDIQAPCESDDDCLSGYCNRYVSNRTCGLGLTFSPESPSCIAFMSNTDAGAGKVPVSPTDAGTTD